MAQRLVERLDGWTAGRPIVVVASRPHAGICALALGSTLALAKADLKLPRERITLVAPPFVHAHEQVAKSGPKIIEFKMTVVEKEAGTGDKVK